MISLAALAQEYGATLVDSDGYELEPHELRTSVVRAIRRKLGEQLRIVATLGPAESCPVMYRGELRAAQHAVRVCERDLGQLVEQMRSEAA